jgi:hypothetical protein
MEALNELRKKIILKKYGFTAGTNIKRQEKQAN